MQLCLQNIIKPEIRVFIKAKSDPARQFFSWELCLLLDARAVIEKHTVDLFDLSFRSPRLCK